jgi:diguanylate cyclase (GGDEF)-like protein
MEKRKVISSADNADLFNSLLLDVAQAVGKDMDNNSSLSGELKKIRDFFSFGNAFIYEANPEKHFVLREHPVAFQHDELKEIVILEEIFTSDQIALILKDPLCCATPNLNNNEIQQTLCAYFKIQSVFQIFIIDRTGAIVGLVGMADKRKHEPLSEQEYTQALTLLKLIAEHSRTRIIKRQLEYTSATLENIMNHMGLDIYANDFHTHEMLYANESMAAPYGGWENMKGKTCHAALYKGQTEECEYCPKQHLIDGDGNPNKTVYAWDYQRPFDKTWFRVTSTVIEWVDGRLANVISSTNINQMKNNELLVQQMAYHDLLTGIPNRRMLEQDLKDLIADPVKKEQGFSVLFLDLDNFKELNDTYGHNSGDALLRHIAQRLMESPLTSGHCYRYGGDEFIFLFESTSVDEGLQKGREITTLLEAPFALKDNTMLMPTGSIGLAHYPEQGKDYWELLDHADGAMYEAKQERKLKAKK